MAFNEAVHCSVDICACSVSDILALYLCQCNFWVQNDFTCCVELTAFDRSELPNCCKQRIKVVAKEGLVVTEKFDMIGHEETLIVTQINFDFHIVLVLFPLLVDKAKELSTVWVVTHF